MLDTAIRAVQIAGEILKVSTPGNVKKWSKDDNPRHIVSEIDYRVESEVRDFLQSVTPKISVLGEELSPNDQQFQCGQVWVLDPLDGTSNYMQGLNHYSVSLAMLEKGEPIIGVVYNPRNDDLFTAVKGQGASLNHTSLHMTGGVELKEGFVCIEWGRTDASIQVGLAILQKMAPLIGESRFLGGAALTLCYVASGTLHAYIDHGLDIWDYAAGRLIVQEAGGTVLKLPTLDDNLLIAASPTLAETISELLSDITS